MNEEAKTVAVANPLPDTISDQNLAELKKAIERSVPILARQYQCSSLVVLREMYQFIKKREDNIYPPRIYD